jgi:hypothetical protein
MHPVNAVRGLPCCSSGWVKMYRRNVKERTWSWDAKLDREGEAPCR